MSEVARRRYRSSRRTRAWVRRPRLLAAAAVLAYYGWLRLVAWYDLHRAGVQVAAVLALAGLLLAAAVFVAVVIRSHHRQAVTVARAVEAEWSLAQLVGGDGSALEEATADMAARGDTGLWDVQIPGGAGDMGADVTGYAPNSRRFVVIQCKAYAARRKVGSGDIQRFNGTVWMVHNAQVAVFVTTARALTADAAWLAEQSGIYVVTGPDLAEVLAGRRPLIPARLLADDDATALLPVVESESVEA